jgi:chemotaxis protein histidine kinase CheA
MNGEIKVKSKVDKGSTFTVVLPLTVPEANTEKWRTL